MWKTEQYKKKTEELLLQATHEQSLSVPPYPPDPGSQTSTAGCGRPHHSWDTQSHTYKEGKGTPLPSQEPGREHTNKPQIHHHHLNSPRPGVFCETHPGGVSGSGCLGHYADLLASLVAGLKHGALCQLLLCTPDPLASSGPFPAPSRQAIPTERL